MARSVGEVFVTVLANTTAFERQVVDAAEDAAKQSRTRTSRQLTQAFNDVGKRVKADRRLDRIIGDTGRQLARTFGLSFDEGIGDIALTGSLNKQLRKLYPELKDQGEDFAEFQRRIVKRIFDEQARAYADLNRQAQQENRQFDREQKRAADEQARRIAQRVKEYQKIAAEGRRLTARLAAAAERDQARRATYWTKIAQQALRDRIRIAQQEASALRVIQQQLAEQNLRNVERSLQSDPRFAQTLQSSIARQRAQRELLNQKVAVTNRLRQVEVDLSKAVADNDADTVRALVRQQDGLQRINRLIANRLTQVNKANAGVFNADSRVLNTFDRSLKNLQFRLRRAGTGGFFNSFTNFLAIGPGLIRTFSRIGSSARVLAKPIQAAGNALELFANARNLTFLSRIGAGLARVGAALGPVLGIVGALGGAAFGLATLTKIVGVAASALNALVGAATIVGTSLLYASGAALAFVPAIAALPAALGTLAVGFRGVLPAFQEYSKYLDAVGTDQEAEALESYNKALANLTPNAKKAVEAMQGLAGRFKEIREAVQERLFQGVDKDFFAGFNRLVNRTERGMVRMAGSIRRGLGEIRDLFTQDKFLEDYSKNWTGLSGIIETFGSVIANTVGALNSLITALLPYGQRLLDYFDDLTGSWQEFTQSAEGKNAIKDFMDDAWEAARTLKNILGTFGGTLGTIFGASQESGQSFLDKLLVKAELFKAWIDERVADGRFQAWLRDVERIGGEVFGALEEVVKTIDRLDTPENRQSLTGILEGFQEVLRFVQDDFIPVMEGIWDEVSGAWGSLSGIFDNIKVEFSQFATTVIKPILETIQSLPGSESWFGDVSGALESIDNLSASVDTLLAERPMPVWTEDFTVKLLRLRDEGVLTKAAMSEILVAAERNVPFSPQLIEDLARARLQGEFNSWGVQPDPRGEGSTWLAGQPCREHRVE